MRLINLTPHEIVVRGDGGTVTIPPCGMVARVETRTGDPETWLVDGVAIPVRSQALGQVVSLPEPEDGTGYIVSLPVAQALAGQRPDVVSPGPLIRDEAGRPVACDGLVRTSRDREAGRESEALSYSGT